MSKTEGSPHHISNSRSAGPEKGKIPNGKRVDGKEPEQTGHLPILSSFLAFFSSCHGCDVCQTDGRERTPQKVENNQPLFPWVPLVVMM